MIQRSLNLFLGIIKWPMAAAMILMFVPALVVNMRLVTAVVGTPHFASFGLAMFFSFVIGMIFFQRGWLGIFATFGHEATHLFFAVLTFHKPMGMDIHSGGGGAFKYRGEGNWLIALSPYFFPLFPFLAMMGSLAYIWTGDPIPDGYYIFLGIVTGYHLCSMLSDLHGGQTDFDKAGRIFSLLFLPAAILICYGVILAFVGFGWPGVETFFRSLWVV